MDPSVLGVYGVDGGGEVDHSRSSCSHFLVTTSTAEGTKPEKKNIKKTVDSDLKASFFFKVVLQLTQLFERLLHVLFSVNVARVGRQQREILTLWGVTVHLYVDPHCSQRFLSLEGCCDGRAIQEADLWIRRRSVKRAVQVREKSNKTHVKNVRCPEELRNWI